MRLLRRVKKTRLLAALTVVAATLVSAPASSAPGDCRIPEYSANHPVGRQTAAGHYEYQDWLANETAAKAVGGLGAELESRFGSQAEQERSNAWLARGWIGVAADHEAQEYVVVVDPALVDRPELARRLQATVDRTFGPGNSGFTVRVAPGCFSARELAEAKRTIDGRRWHSAVATSSYAFYLDAYDSSYHFTFRPEDHEVAAALKAQLGDRVTITYDDIADLGRLDDGEPHYGGAGIRAGSEGSNHCTSTFTVRLSSGVKGSLTAAHCFRETGNGDINGRNVYSGPQYYGISGGASGYPQYDMVRIQPDGETFDNKIHVDPCCPSVRNVVASGNPNLHDFVCVSGKTTKAKCGAEVLDLNATRCYLAQGCTPNLMYARKPGEVIAAGGDSGGPVYNRYGDTGAAARGMINAGIRTGGDYFYGHKIQAIESHLNVTVSTG